MKEGKKVRKPGIGRREFFRYSGALTAGAVLGGALSCSKQADKMAAAHDLMQEVMKYRKIDSHIHVYISHEPERVIKSADLLGIEKLVISRPCVPWKDMAEGNPEQFRESNDLVLKSMKMYPDRFLGQCTLNPTYQKESFEEIKRCVDAGMIGLKVYLQVKINNPLYYPIIEKCIDLNFMILMHSNVSLGMGGYRMKYDKGEYPNTSIPEDFVDIAKRYPEAMLQFAHIGGGGDWEYMCKALKDSPNVWIDTSGSNNEEGQVDFALKTIGEDRMFFGSDNTFYQSVGRILSANLTEQQRKKIFFENYNNILRRAGNHVS
ncbi:amidohydrolase family protein [candidate division KSB1 bacterium]